MQNALGYTVIHLNIITQEKPWQASCRLIAGLLFGYDVLPEF